MRLRLLVSLTVLTTVFGFSLAHGFDSWGTGRQPAFEAFSGRPGFSGRFMPITNEQWGAINNLYQDYVPEMPYMSSSSDDPEFDNTTILTDDFGFGFVRPRTLGDGSATDWVFFPVDFRSSE